MKVFCLDDVMAALENGVKQFIVKALACFDTPTQVAEAVKAEYGLDVSRQQVATYDPTKYNGQYLSPKLRMIFECTRERFFRELDDIPIASRAFRLRALARMATKAEKRQNIELAVRMIEQAAKEAGDFYLRRNQTPSRGPQPGVAGVRTAADYTLEP